MRVLEGRRRGGVKVSLQPWLLLFKEYFKYVWRFLKIKPEFLQPLDLGRILASRKIISYEWFFIYIFSAIPWSLLYFSRTFFKLIFPFIKFPTKELILCHKLWFSNPCICASQCPNAVQLIYSKLWILL